MEEFLGVAARYDACALIVEQWRRVPLKDTDIVAQAFQNHAGEEAAEGATDLDCCFCASDYDCASCCQENNQAVLVCPAGESTLPSNGAATTTERTALVAGTV